jgi:thiamine pyrophosphokinase
MGDETTVVIFAGGDPLTGDVPALVPRGATVLAADSGLHAALDHGIAVDLLIGDLDSVDPARVDPAVTGGMAVEQFPSAKDETDLELALTRAIELGARRIVVIGGHGGRLDHQLANALLLTSERFASAAVEAHFERSRAHVVRSDLSIEGRVGDLLTLLPVHGAAHGVTTEGLRYPLRGETLRAGSTRGVSNELTATRASVHLDAGVLLAITPTESDP